MHVSKAQSNFCFVNPQMASSAGSRPPSNDQCGLRRLVAPSRQRTTKKARRRKNRTPRPATNNIKMVIAVTPPCARDLAHVAQCWDIDRKDRLRHQRAAGLMVTLTTQVRQIRAEPPTRRTSKVWETCEQRCGDDAGLSFVNPEGRTDLRRNDNAVQLSTRFSQGPRKHSRAEPQP